MQEFFGTNLLLLMSTTTVVAAHCMLLLAKDHGLFVIDCATPVPWHWLRSFYYSDFSFPLPS